MLHADMLHTFGRQHVSLYCCTVPGIRYNTTGATCRVPPPPNCSTNTSTSSTPRTTAVCCLPHVAFEHTKKALLQHGLFVCRVPRSRVYRYIPVSSTSITCSYQYISGTWYLVYLVRVHPVRVQCRIIEVRMHVYTSSYSICSEV